MHDENPTGEQSGASISERLENFLAAEESPAEPKPKAAANESGNDDQSQDAPKPADPAEPKDDPQDDAQGEADESQMTTAELAKLFGVDESAFDVDDDGNAVIKTKIDGKDGTAKFDDLIKSYQLRGHVDNESRSVAEQKRVLQQRMSEVEQAAAARVQHLDQLIGMADQELTREYQSIDWQRLRAENPGEYSARLTDFNARKQSLQQAAQAVQVEREQQQQQRQTQLQEFLAAEREKLATVIPEWKDSATASKEQREIKEWGLKVGFESHELDSIARSAHVAALRKAMLYDRLQESKKAVEAKVRTAPKLVKPGQAPSENREQQTVRNLRTRIVKSGGTQGIRDYLLATNKV